MDQLDDGLAFVVVGQRLQLLLLGRSGSWLVVAVVVRDVLARGRGLLGLEKAFLAFFLGGGEVRKLRRVVQVGAGRLGGTHHGRNFTFII